VRVRQSCSHEELEVFVVLKRLLADFDNVTFALLDLLLKQDWLKGRVDFSADVLKENPFAELDTHLNVAHQVGS
jgi:hypothetical protein